MHAQTSTVTGPVVSAFNIAFFSHSVPTSNARHLYGLAKDRRIKADTAGKSARGPRWPE